ncbi:MAG: hypothetical protein SGPRY_011696, partial [Prymnesium sp.]
AVAWDRQLLESKLSCRLLGQSAFVCGFASVLSALVVRRLCFFTPTGWFAQHASGMLVGFAPLLVNLACAFVFPVIPQTFSYSRCACIVICILRISVAVHVLMAGLYTPSDCWLRTAVGDGLFLLPSVISLIGYIFGWLPDWWRWHRVSLVAAGVVQLLRVVLQFLFLEDLGYYPPGKMSLATALLIGINCCTSGLLLTASARWKLAEVLGAEGFHLRLADVRE